MSGPLGEPGLAWDRTQGCQWCHLRYTSRFCWLCLSHLSLVLPHRGPKLLACGLCAGCTGASCWMHQLLCLQTACTQDCVPSLMQTHPTCLHSDPLTASCCACRSTCTQDFRRFHQMQDALPQLPQWADPGLTWAPSVIKAGGSAEGHPGFRGAPERGAAWLNGGQVRMGCCRIGCVLSLSLGMQLMGRTCTLQLHRLCGPWLWPTSTGSSPVILVLRCTPSLRQPMANCRLCRNRGH